jgi:acetyltransferase-like isoleucine patch superfamily enzyme
MSRVLDGVTFGVNAIVSAGAGETLHVGATAECSLRF